MAKGGAGYNVFKTKRLRYYPGNEVDIDIVLRYIKARTPLTIGLDGRVRINKSTMKNVAFSFERKVHLILSSFLTYVTWNFYL